MACLAEAVSALLWGELRQQLGNARLHLGDRAGVLLAE